MSASDIRLDDLHQRDLDDLVGQTRIALHAREEAVHRLLRTAFRDPAISARFMNQVAMRGPDEALAVARGRSDLPRALWFGRLRGDAVFNRALRAEAQAALDQLPDALRVYMATRDELRDLTAMRDRIVPTGRTLTTREPERDRTALNRRRDRSR